MDEFQFDEIDQAHIETCVAARDAILRPRVGDFVRFPTGEVERFSHDWEEDFQTSPLWAGSFYLSGCGNASFSGSLHPAIPLSSLTLTEESRDGKFWFFHHNRTGGGRGVTFSTPCRVYATTAQYKGYLTRGI